MTSFIYVVKVLLETWREKTEPVKAKEREVEMA
jgi:hypothetical protein